MFNISEFKSRINRHGGPAKTNLFVVTFGAGNIPGIISTDDLRFFCQSVAMPGVNLELMSYKEGGIGYPEFMPMDASPDSLNAIFMMDSNHKILSFFHRWINSVINVNATRGPIPAGLEPKEINYKSNYTTTMTIDFYSAYDNTKFYRSTFGGVFPTQVGSLNLSWSDNDTLAVLPVNFSYNQMFHEGVQTISPEQSRFLLSQDNSTLRGSFFQNLFDFQRTINAGAEALT